MKVCIVTMHRAENCGAYMQAYALGETVKELGHEVVYLKPNLRWQVGNIKVLCLDLLKALAKLDFRFMGMKLRFHAQAMRDIRRFSEIRRPRGVDRFVLGSDVIWQIRSSFVRREINRYFGLDFPGKKVFSYAPSANGTSLEQFRQDARVKKALERMRAISVRDTDTRNTLAQLTDRPIEVVCDPVLLHDRDFYRRVQRKCPYRKFILVYAFRRNFTNEQRIDEIRAFAAKRGLKLVSFGLNRSWCDISVPYDYLSMSAYFDRADYVITNTFHGSIFSILFGKRFVQFSRKKRKVVNLMEQFDLTERILHPECTLETVLDAPADDARWQACIAELRRHSIEYLQKNLAD